MCLCFGGGGGGEEVGEMMTRVLIAGVTSYCAPYRPRQETDDIANDLFSLI